MHMLDERRDSKNLRDYLQSAFGAISEEDFQRLFHRAEYGGSVAKILCDYAEKGRPIDAKALDYAIIYAHALLPALASLKGAIRHIWTLLNERDTALKSVWLADQLVRKMRLSKTRSDEERAYVESRGGEKAFEARFMWSADLEWAGSICGIVARVDQSTPKVYSVGDHKPCFLCNSTAEKPCIASVRLW